MRDLTAAIDLMPEEQVRADTAMQDRLLREGSDISRREMERQLISKPESTWADLSSAGFRTGNGDSAMSAVGRMQLKMMGDQNVMDALKSSDAGDSVARIQALADSSGVSDQMRRMRELSFQGLEGRRNSNFTLDRASQAKMIGNRSILSFSSIANRAGDPSRQEFRNSVGVQRSFGLGENGEIRDTVGPAQRAFLRLAMDDPRRRG
jgi:hypothetical protein